MALVDDGTTFSRLFVDGRSYLTFSSCGMLPLDEMRLQQVSNSYEDFLDLVLIRKVRKGGKKGSGKGQGKGKKQQ